MKGEGGCLFSIINIFVSLHKIFFTVISFFLLLFSCVVNNAAEKKIQFLLLKYFGFFKKLWSFSPFLN